MTRYTRRELPPYRHRPGRTPHPERHPDGHLYGRPEPAASPLDPTTWRTNEEYLYGVDLFNAGFYWEAHAAWESVWNATPRGSVESRFVRALIQLAAAALKGEMGESAGARKLHARSTAKLESLAPLAEDGRFLGVHLEDLRARSGDADREAASPPRIELAL